MDRSQPDPTQVVDEVIADVPAPGVVRLRVHRPEKRNALTRNVKRLLAQAVLAAGEDAQVRVVLLTGSEDVFVAGTDIAEMADMNAYDHVVRQTDALWDALAGLRKPIVAAVNGYALGGGCELALHADVIVAGETARFGQPEIKLGIMSELITARDALAAGMVSEVVPDDRALPRALEIASTIAQMPQRAVRAIKDVVTLGLDAPLSVALAAERRAFQLLFDTPDQKEGMAAFLERRAPNFEHAS